MKYSVLAAIMNHLGIEDNEYLPANGHQLQDFADYKSIPT